MIRTRKSHEDKPPCSASPNGRSKFDASMLRELPNLKRYALSLTGDPHDANDLVQDCSVRALANRERFQPDTHMRRWLFTILRNLYYDRCRSRGRQGQPIAIEDCDARALGKPASQDDWMALVECRERIRELRRDDRDVLYLTVFSKLSQRDVARMMGIAEGTVRSRLSRARKALRG